ncbi:prepilin peptidase [Candidatus Azambacteria bacterium]|nr:prepilin peptidase [Candidatus Azambacteria bacterium]
MRTFLAVMLGFFLGSFLNVVALRWPLKSILFGRSACPHCGSRLSWWELIPLASFLVLRGRCWHCGGKISWQYPIVEVSTALYLGLLASRPLEEFFFFALLGALLLVLAAIDARTYVLPDVLLFLILTLGLLGNLILFPSSLARMLFGVLFGGGFFLFLYLASGGRWLGFGDVKLGAVLGLLLGWPTVVFALSAAAVAGGALASLLLLSGKKGWKSPIPFGPFLVFGTLLAIILGGAYAPGSWVFWY